MSSYGKIRIMALFGLAVMIGITGIVRGEEVLKEDFQAGSRAEFHLFKVEGGAVKINETALCEEAKPGGGSSFLIDCTLSLDVTKHKMGKVYAYFYLPTAPLDPKGVFCRAAMRAEVIDAPEPKPLVLVYSYGSGYERGVHGLIEDGEGNWPEARITFGCAVIDEFRRYVVGHFAVNAVKPGPGDWRRWEAASTIMGWHYPYSRFVGPMVGLAAHLSEEKPQVRIKVYVDDLEVSREPIYEQAGLKALKKTPHPYLVATKQQFARARLRAEKHEWARKLVEGFVRPADLYWLKEKVAIPREFAGYGTAYYCEDEQCRGQLSANRDVAGEMKCAKCERRYAGRKWERVCAGLRHSALGAASYNLGMAYQLTGKKEYGLKAKDILVAYGRCYRDYPLRIHEGQLSWNWLGDCYFVETAIKAYDLCYDLFTPEERRIVEDGLFLPAARLIYHFPGAAYVSGTVRIMAATGLIGLALKNDELVYLQLLSPHTGAPGLYGYAFTADGLSLLGGAYHNVAIWELASLGVAAENAGMKFFGPEFKALLDGMIGLRFPDGNFSAFGHSGGGSLTGLPYSEGYAFYGDRRYLPFVAKHDLRHLLYIADDDISSDAEKPLLQSSNFPHTGYTFLRAGPSNDPACLAFNWGPPQRNDHAKLAIQFYACGAHLAVPSGTAPYGHPLYGKWFAQSLQSNTLLVDGKRQAPCMGYQTFIWTEGPARIASAYTDTAYPGVRLERTAILLENGIAVLVDRCASQQEHVYDWALHGGEEIATPLKMEKAASPPSGEDPYQAIQDVWVCATAGSWQAVFYQKKSVESQPRPEAAAMRVTMLGGESTFVYRALGFGHGGGKTVPMLIARRSKVKETVFVSVLAPYRKEPLATEVKSVPVSQGGKPTDQAVGFTISPGDQPGRSASKHLILVSFTEGMLEAIGKTTDRKCQVFVLK